MLCLPSPARGSHVLLMEGRVGPHWVTGCQHGHVRRVLQYLKNQLDAGGWSQRGPHELAAPLGTGKILERALHYLSLLQIAYQTLKRQSDPI